MTGSESGVVAPELVTGDELLRDRARAALAEIYHGWFTGLLLAVVARAGAELAGELVFRIYRRHHEQRFLASFDKLALTGLPHAVACARYHYLANRIGGVGVEYMEESDRKAWVRFSYPRWIYEGTALCAMPVSVSRGMLYGWYAHNGVSLNNPNLAFVCTSEDMPHPQCPEPYGLAGYFIERSAPVDDDARLTFAFAEVPPPFEPERAPILNPVVWTDARLTRARVNYAVDLLVLALVAAIDLLGPEQAEVIARNTARICGTQACAKARGDIGDVARRASTADAFARFATILLYAGGDAIQPSDRSSEFTQLGWRFGRGMGHGQSLLAKAWTELWRGLAVGFSRELRLDTDWALASDPMSIRWAVSQR